MELLIINGDLRRFGYRCVVPISKADGLVQYFKFKGHPTTWDENLNWSKVEDKVQLSEGDSMYCAEQKAATSQENYQVRDEVRVSGIFILTILRGPKSQLSSQQLEARV
jgi:hypothetical protein